MTDDIVTRLREHHKWFGSGGQPTSVWEDAADEIERLRENNEYLNKTVDLLLAANKQRRSSGK